MVPGGWEGPQYGKTPFSHVYIFKKNPQSQQANFNQTWCKSFLGKDNHNMQKLDEVIEKFSP
jgi:hypothetical protein